MAAVRRSHGLATNPFRLFPRVIVSMSWLPPARAQRPLREMLSAVERPRSARRFAFDALGADESHHPEFSAQRRSKGSGPASQPVRAPLG